MTGEQPSHTDAEQNRVITADARAAYRLPHVILPVVLFLATTAGTQATFSDAGGDNVLGYAAIATPSVLAAYWSIAWLWQRNRTQISLLARMVSGCLLVQIPLIILNSLMILVLALLPVNQQVLSSISGNHYWWSEYGPAGQAGMMALGSYGVSAFFGIMAVIIIVLPISSITNPEMMAEGSNLERVSKGQPRNLMAAFVYGGLGVFTLGLCLRYLLGGTSTFSQFVNWFGRGISSFTLYDMDYVWWGLGTGLIGLGIAAMAIGCIGVIVAGIRRSE